jgi:phosphoglycolate phosphatase-like HAD superfamily hydrolase
MVRGVLLDVDGTLVLSNDAHAHAWVEAFAKQGIEITFEQVRPLIGMGGDKIIPRLVPGLSSEEGQGKDISNSRSQIFLDKYASSLQPAPGSRALVEHMLSLGLKLIVASSAKEDELGVLLRAAQVDDLLQEATTSSDADESKPDPDIIQVALKKIDLPPVKVLMLGDTPYDTVAASRVGISTVALRCGGWKNEDLKDTLAIYDDPADLLAHYDTSPLAN